MTGVHKLAVFVTRGGRKWFVGATSADGVRETCRKQGWEFDSIEEVPATGFTDLFKQWGIGKLVDEIGARNDKAARRREVSDDVRDERDKGTAPEAKDTVSVPLL